MRVRYSIITIDTLVYLTHLFSDLICLKHHVKLFCCRFSKRDTQSSTTDRNEELTLNSIPDFWIGIA